MIQIGHLNQKANQGLVFFVFECILGIYVLLNLMQQAQKIDYNEIMQTEMAQYLN